MTPEELRAEARTATQQGGPMWKTAEDVETTRAAVVDLARRYAAAELRAAADGFSAASKDEDATDDGWLHQAAEGLWSRAAWLESHRGLDGGAR